MNIKIKKINIDMYEELFQLWKKIEGIGLRNADKKENIEKYLKRNKGYSFAAFHDGKLIGSLLAGHDGRRGYLYHLAVNPDFRRKGIAKQLLEQSIEKLKKSGIKKTHIFIFKSNKEGKKFWKAVGWKYRDDIDVMSKYL
ncbi:MAG: GNAT family N-acetyltransferase [Candidatus Mcinerneyibacterium aminivorans]|uniref:GNAT family N-acetyltransferase n=1 Tax=Candidatus Mcinerneyibacterium aminivorans TaxID=2703815 RepID=A0A5D0MIZ9_9BACT|nr:MAG: GNAT family N-acetyltransferase [Candidatus Mcinerneyibacterium aminivorans]